VRHLQDTVNFRASVFVKHARHILSSSHILWQKVTNALSQILEVSSICPTHKILGLNLKCRVSLVIQCNIPIQGSYIANHKQWENPTFKHASRSVSKYICGAGQLCHTPLIDAAQPSQTGV